MVSYCVECNFKLHLHGSEAISEPLYTRYLRTSTRGNQACPHQGAMATMEERMMNVEKGVRLGEVVFAGGGCG